MRIALPATLILQFLVASLASGQPVKVHVFTSPNSSGFVTAESKLRQHYTDLVIKELSKKKKVVTLSATAALTIEITSVENRGTGASETYNNPTAAAFGVKSPVTREIRETHITSRLRFDDYEQELVGINRGAWRQPDKHLAYLVESWVKDNNARLQGK